MDIENYSKQQLIDELKRREIPMPKVVDRFDEMDLTVMVVEHVENIMINGRDDEDAVHYIYECALTSVYGNDIFKKYINQRLK